MQPDRPSAGSWAFPVFVKAAIFGPLGLATSETHERMTVASRFLDSTGMSRRQTERCRVQMREAPIRPPPRPPWEEHGATWHWAECSG